MKVEKPFGLIFVLVPPTILYCYFSDVWPGRVFYNTIFADLLLIICMDILFLYGICLFVDAYEFW